MKQIINNLATKYPNYKFNLEEIKIKIQIDEETLVLLRFLETEYLSSAGLTKVIFINDERIELTRPESISNDLVKSLEVKKDIYNIIYGIQDQININDYKYCLEPIKE